jgi:6,7-dimethyl-8-ribityllumazine synthase
MYKLIEGNLIGKGYRITIILSRFNSFITDRLLDGAVDELSRLSVEGNSITVYKVPGSFEIPMFLKQVIQNKNTDGIICLGALIRGDTQHFDLLAHEVMKGISEVSLSSNTPVSFGILTCDTLEQAIERAGTKSGNYGASAAKSLLEMINLYKRIEK